jgi:hypothetical protein
MPLSVAFHDNAGGLVTVFVFYFLPMGAVDISFSVVSYCYILLLIARVLERYMRWWPGGGVCVCGWMGG